tara:strand:- start:174 stop:479 length:306 start_codon:yes stop_codon:yes gene_type:complete
MTRFKTKQNPRSLLREFKIKIKEKKFQPSLELQKLLNNFRSGKKEGKYILYKNYEKFFLGQLPKERGEKIIIHNKIFFSNLIDAEIFVFKKRLNEYFRLYR